MSNLKKALHKLLDTLLTLVVGLVPVVSGLLVMVYQLDRKLEENARVSLQEAIFAIDRSLDSLQVIASRALPLTELTCSQAQDALQSLVASEPQVHSLVLVKKQQGYCGTLSNAELSTSRFAEQGPNVQLNLDSPLFRNGVAVEYRVDGNKADVVAITDDQMLRSELRGFQDGLVLVLQFGGNALWSDGDSYDTALPSQAELFSRAKSSKHGYEIKVGYPEGYRALEARASALQIIPSLVLVGVLTSAIAYWGVFRRRKQIRRTVARSD